MGGDEGIEWKRRERNTKHSFPCRIIPDHLLSDPLLLLWLLLPLSILFSLVVSTPLAIFAGLTCCYPSSSFFFFLPCLLLAFYKYILPSFSLFFILFILSFSYLPSLLFSIRFLSYFLLFWNSQLYVTCAARVFRGQCRRFLDWWLEGGRMEEEELGPLLTKDLQYTFGPSLECVCVCECASCCSFLSWGQKWSHHLLMIISQKFKFSYRNNKKLLDIKASTSESMCGPIWI